MNRRRVIAVACAIIERGSRFLTTRRGSGRRALLWEFPGGKRRPRETIDACIVREILEELGIRVRPLRKLQPVRWRYPDAEICLHPVICRYRSGRIKLREHMAAEWLTPVKAAGYEWCGADRPILEQYIAQRRRSASVSAPARVKAPRRNSCSRSSAGRRG